MREFRVKVVVLAAEITLDFPPLRLKDRAASSESVKMENPELDRIHIAHVLRDRKLAGGLLVYCALIPLPILLMGSWQVACFALLLCFIYVYLNPTMMMPSKAEIDEMMRAGVSAPRKIDQTGQMLSDKMYGDLAGQDDNTMTPDGRIYADIHNFQQMNNQFRQ